MIRAIRPAAVARDDASLITGWNIAPNVGYTVTLSVSASAVVAIMYSADGSTLIGSGVALVGTDQPVTIYPVSGQTVDMVDADMGWHLLVTTSGTEGERTITMDPMVDLADEIHPIYTDDGMALARATAAINSGASYVDDVSVNCPLGIGAGIGAVASAPVDGVAVVGQVESVTWSGTPDGTSETAVIRRHTAIAPEAYTLPPAPPVLVDDAAETDAATATSGNVLTNDTGTLTVSAVNGLSANVGRVVTGSEGGEFVINADGSWTFDPSGDFSALSGSETADTSVTYHASDGVAESSATLTVTVSSGFAPELWTPSEITTAIWLKEEGTASSWTDHSGNSRHFTQETASAQPSLSGELNDLVIRTFDGADRMDCSASVAFTAQSVFVVARHSGSATYQRIFTQSDSGSDYGNTGHYIPLLRVAASTNIGSYAANGERSVVTLAKNTFGILGSVHDGAALQNFIHGVAGASYSHSLSKTFTRFCVGNLISTVGTGALTGAIAEVIVTNYAVGLGTRQKIEGYLAHKWGLVAALPSDHPYKSSPPTV